MPALLPILLAGSHLLLVADKVPVLNIEPSCRAAAAAAVTGGRNEDACRRDENAARAKLEQDWGQYTAAQHSQCVSLSTLGGSPSYVELLTCLEMTKPGTNAPPDGGLGGMKKGRIER